MLVDRSRTIDNRDSIIYGRTLNSYSVNSQRVLSRLYKGVSAETPSGSATGRNMAG